MSKCVSGILTLMVFSVLILSFLILTPSLSLSAELKMKWDANKPTPQGYRLFQRTQGQAYNYTMPVWTGSATTATIGKLEDSTQYYFVVRAFKGDAESADSNEIAFKSTSPALPGTSTAAKPKMTPDGGKFSGSVKVRLKTTTPGAKIYYTTNGKTPSKSSTRYTKPFTLKMNTTVKAFAVASGYKNSAMASATFTKSGDLDVDSGQTEDDTRRGQVQRLSQGQPEDHDPGCQDILHHQWEEAEQELDPLHETVHP